MKKLVRLNTVIKNVAPRFHRTIWREYEVNKYYDSVADMAKEHNVKNCNYQFEDENENIIKVVRNGKIDCYGKRYN